jgi:transcriptional regulator with XRE-family HTH domain
MPRNTTTSSTSIHSHAFPVLPSRPSDGTPLHRIAEARLSQNFSLANAARHLGIDVATARRHEDPQSDLLLSELHRWAEIMEIPVAELLAEPEADFSPQIKDRAKMVRLMKTTRTILECAKEKRIRLLAETLVEQLVEMMPELAEVTAWPSIGQSREFKDYGSAAYRRFDEGVSRMLDDF